MEIFNTVSTLQKRLNELRAEGQTVGLIPTMGALHQGHLSLIDIAREQSDIVVASIFVNPKQFNDSTDFNNYPRTLETDANLLKKQGCHMLFAPPYDEVYDGSPTYRHDFGALATVMEGTHRPGHFEGMAMVVKRFFDIVMPDFAFFGQKDYQQLQIIKVMVAQENLPITVVGCPTVREASGLAMSSRNMLLSEQERNTAALLSKVLFDAKEMAQTQSVAHVQQYALQQLGTAPRIVLEYFQLVDGNTLQPLETWDRSKSAVACIAARIGEVRLIDNVILFT